MLDLRWTSGGAGSAGGKNHVCSVSPALLGLCWGGPGLGSSGKETAPVECRFLCILEVNAGSGLSGEHGTKSS